MEIRTLSADFSNPMRGSGPRVLPQTLVFARQVNVAVAGIVGYSVAFSPNDDHNVGKVQIEVDTAINGNTVTVTASLGLRDWSGDWDDNYQGRIEFAVLADLAPLSAPPPRGDLQVTGMEINQAVQFFRSATYLDTATARPDNSIPVVARKETGVRVYVDYDASAGLAPINRLTGELVVQTSATTLVRSPINTGGFIPPRADSTINMAVANHTLNFDIPAIWCTGEVTLRCQVWDLDSPATRSAAFTRTLVFNAAQPLNIYLVGVGDNAAAPPVVAPTQAQILSSSLPQLIKTYPIGDIVVTGYTTISFTDPVGGNLASGCGSYSDVLDRLDDLRGDSSDIYLGIVANNIPLVTGNTVGGCGRGGLAATFLNNPADVPHEIGHALGRQHAPCTQNRCSIAPANVDPNYPQYGNFPSDSIGVFGFDPTISGDPVKNPASIFDFMAYSFPQWVSAYTYAAIGGAFPTVGGPGPGAISGAHMLEGVQSEVLHLRLTIARDRTVTRIPSFHYAGPRSAPSRCSEFTAELLDEKREVLACTPLACQCEKGCQCWPKDIRDAIPYPEGSRWLVIWEKDTKIYEEEIPEPPEVEIASAEEDADGLYLEWTGQASDGDPELWYLVQWHDEEVKTWRGVAPRQQETKLVIPRRFFRHGSDVDLRVLCTSGIATGSAEATVKIRSTKGNDVVITLVDDPAATNSHHLRAIALDSSGRQFPSDWLRWYDAHGAEIARGASLDTRALPARAQLVRAVLEDLTAHSLATAWFVEGGALGARVHNYAGSTAGAAPADPGKSDKPDKPNPPKRPRRG